MSTLITLWRAEWAAKADREAMAYRAAGCFDLANLRAEQAHSHRSGFCPVMLERRLELGLGDRVELSKANEREWDRLTDEGIDLAHSRPFGPSRKASARCQSGGHDYCTCPVCWG